MINKLLQAVLNFTPLQIRNQIKYIPVAKQLQSLMLKYFLNNTEFDATITAGPAKGLIFPIKLPQDKQIWIGTWELEFAKKLRDSMMPGTICYDIGGYKGFYSGIMALGGASQVYVFEPVPQNAKKIARFISLNSKLPIQLLQIAVSDKVEKAQFKIMSEDTMGKLNTSEFQVEENSLTEFSVECNTIDNLIEKGLAAPDFIKIDVEGAEEFVLKGGIKLLKERKPRLFIEIHSKEIGKACNKILSQFYSEIIVFETGLPPQNGEPEICHYLVS